MNYPRRKFLKKTGQTIVAGGLVTSIPLIISSCGGGESKSADEAPGAAAGEGGASTSSAASTETATSSNLFFQISLAQWSLHKTIFDGKMDNLDFAATTKNEFGISAVEYVNQFFKDKAEDQSYLGEMKKRAEDNGVKSLLIMIDGEGYLGSTDDAERVKAVENHYKWVEAAKFLGCHSIRVNAAGQGTAEEVSTAAMDGLGKLSTFAKDHNINVIVENHGGYSSDGKWLSGVISGVGMDNCGTLPDFGNFCIERSDNGCANEYDRYQGMIELMPFAKGVSAKSNVFNDTGDEVNIDYKRILKTVKDAGYSGYIGIEYEGSELSEMDGIKATKALLEKVGGMV